MATIDTEAKQPYFYSRQEDNSLQGPESYEGPWYDWTIPQRKPETDIGTLATASWEGV